MIRFAHYKEDKLYCCDEHQHQEVRHITLENLFDEQDLFGYIPITYRNWCDWWTRHGDKRAYVMPYFHKKEIWCPISSVYQSEVFCINLYGLQNFQSHSHFIRCYFKESVIDLYISKTKMYTLLEQLALMIDRFRVVGIIPEFNTEEWQRNNPYLNIDCYLNRKNHEAIDKKRQYFQDVITVYNFRELLLNENQKSNTEKI